MRIRGDATATIVWMRNCRVSLEGSCFWDKGLYGLVERLL